MPVAPGVPAGWPYGAMTVLVCSIRPSSYVWCPRNSCPRNSVWCPRNSLNSLLNGVVSGVKESLFSDVPFPLLYSVMSLFPSFSVDSNSIGR